MDYLRYCFKDSTSDQITAWLLLVPVVGLFVALAFSGLTIMAPVGWIGLYVIAKTIYKGIRYPETLTDADENEGAGSKGNHSNGSNSSGTVVEDVDVEDLDAAQPQAKSKARRSRSGPARQQEASHSANSDGDFEFDAQRDKFD